MKKSAFTRQTILHKAFELIYINGYQATSIDDIIAQTQVTKGAFYYHFKTKEEMGLAIISEIIKENMRVSMIEPMLKTSDPLLSIYKIMHKLLMLDPVYQVKCGCPVYNLIQEMAPLNENFNNELTKIMVPVLGSIESALENGRASGVVHQDIDSASVANFVMSGYGGIRIIGKLNDDKKRYVSYLKQLKLYLDSLR